ncbi:alpha/beta hydrolase family protein [Microbacterium sp. NPDC057944]|uniref:alpha/beta hydrolase family protein n=1 Tax=Microbacterium sp. NPDC057944 TaxID=3346286 RepID=UPI0036DA631F
MIPGRVVTFPAAGIDGSVQEQTGLLHVPDGPAPAGGRPVVVYGHMTTGGSLRSAPSIGSPEHPEWRRMSQGDALCRMLVARGIAVLRPDYEGIGGPGIHPYLIGASLAESMHAMVRARASFDADLGDAWVAAGHSEGAVAALHASVPSGEVNGAASSAGAVGAGGAGAGGSGAGASGAGASGAGASGMSGADAAGAGASEVGASGAPVPGAVLLGTAAFAPVTRMDLSIGLSRRIGVRFAGSGVVSALIALMLRGAATTDERMRELIAADGLGARAAELWPDLDGLCLTELAAPASWGGLAPGRIGGASGDELFARLAESFRRNEVAALSGFRAPVRIDAARFDEVAPAPLTARLLRRYRADGVELTSAWWPTHHSGTMHPSHAPSRAAAWIAARFS